MIQTFPPRMNTMRPADGCAERPAAMKTKMAMMDKVRTRCMEAPPCWEHQTASPVPRKIACFSPQLCEFRATLRENRALLLRDAEALHRVAHPRCSALEVARDGALVPAVLLERFEETLAVIPILIVSPCAHPRCSALEVARDGA